VITSNRNHEPVYNLPVLFKAIAKVKPQIKNLQFVVTGDGSLRKELEQLAAELGIADVTVFRGRIPQPQMVELLNRTNVFVTVSFSDGNSLSLAEAMACGAFCIASDIPANAQWIVNNKNGFLVPVDDVDALAAKLLFAYTNYEEIQNKGLTLSRQIIAEKGVWKLNMQKIEQKYQSLIAAK